MDVTLCDNAQRPISDAICQGLRDHSEAYLASAFITETGLDRLMDELRRFAQQKRHKLTVVTGDYLGFTSAGALSALDALAGDVNSRSRSQRVTVRVIADAEVGAFHPKVYLFMGAGKALLLVGSANITAAGGGDNIEAYVSISGGSQAEVFQAARRTIAGWSDSGQRITEELTNLKAETEERRKAEDGLLSVLRPFLNPTVNATTDDFIKLCAHTQSIAGRGPLGPVAERLLRSVRAGRIVELHLSHAGFWLPLDAGLFNADRQRRGAQKIGTKTKIHYDIFGRDVAAQLGKLQNAAEYGMRSFGWTTRRGTFVPNTMWRPCEEWFGELRSRYVRTAEAALGPRRGRLKRAQSGLADEVRAIWRRYNRGVQPPPGLEREVRHAIAQHLRDIESGRRRAWRFELQTLPHPVLGWSALLPGLWGADVSDASIDDELADFGLSSLRWLGAKLAACKGKGKGPKACRCIAQDLAATNTIGATPIAEAVAELDHLAAERERGGLELAEWRTSCKDLSAIGSELVVRTTELAEAPSATVLEWLETVTA